MQREQTSQGERKFSENDSLRIEPIVFGATIDYAETNPFTKPTTDPEYVIVFHCDTHTTSIRRDACSPFVPESQHRNGFRGIHLEKTINDSQGTLSCGCPAEPFWIGRSADTQLLRSYIYTSIYLYTDPCIGDSENRWPANGPPAVCIYISTLIYINVYVYTYIPVITSHYDCVPSRSLGQYLRARKEIALFLRAVPFCLRRLRHLRRPVQVP